MHLIGRHSKLIFKRKIFLIVAKKCRYVKVCGLWEIKSPYEEITRIFECSLFKAFILRTKSFWLGQSTSFLYLSDSFDWVTANINFLLNDNDNDNGNNHAPKIQFLMNCVII